MKIIRILLLPFSYLYGSILAIRNFLYDAGIMSSHTFDINVISVGNISVGGTGKTPHIEYLIKLLKPIVTVDETHSGLAVLSRGYGRLTKGFLLANKDAKASEIGDEPLQFKNKHADIHVAVDENRVNGIQRLRTEFPEINTILLDDAYQHRAVKSDISILLTDYYKLYTDDYVVPTGSLREFRSGSKRADIIIVTKTPPLFSPLERRMVKESLEPETYQDVYFSFIKYGDILPLTLKNEINNSLRNDYYFERNYSFLIFTGIAKTNDLVDFIKSKVDTVQHISFADHHRYSVEDLNKIRNLFDNIALENKIILTTEKDAMRLRETYLSDVLIDLPVFYIPIEIVFHDQDEEKFNNQLIENVKKNRINSELYKRKR